MTQIDHSSNNFYSKEQIFEFIEEVRDSADINKFTLDILLNPLKYDIKKLHYLWFGWFNIDYDNPIDEPEIYSDLQVRHDIIYFAYLDRVKSISYRINRKYIKSEIEDELRFSSFKANGIIDDGVIKIVNPYMGPSLFTITISIRSREYSDHIYREDPVDIFR